MSDITVPQFRIVVKGSIHASWSDWFDGLVLVAGTAPDGAQVTILTGAVADQAALRGLLTRLWDLNLSLISVQQIGSLANGRDHPAAETRTQIE